MDIFDIKTIKIQTVAKNIDFHGVKENIKLNI